MSLVYSIVELILVEMKAPMSVLTEKPIFQFLQGKKNIFHSFAGDVKPSDISASNEDIITALEALSGSSSSSKNRKSPRPTSVPFNKSFLSDTTAKVRATEVYSSRTKTLYYLLVLKLKLLLSF
mgnify:CR=1 FL=1